MNISKKQITGFLKIIATLILIGTVLSIIFSPRNLSFVFLLKQAAYSVVIGSILWKGIEIITIQVNKRLSWIKKPKRTAAIQIILTLLYSTLVIFLFYLYIWFFIEKKPTFEGFFENTRGGFLNILYITSIISLFFYSINFFKNWKESVINEERLKRESVTLQYESLKNQVNPHFLFNSLNALTSLIEEDKEASIHYVRQLSNVFRYVLEQNASNEVMLDKELEFIKSYMYLLKIRFGDNLHFSEKIADRHCKIIPLALQILIENAVKHNEISSENPLEIYLSDTPDFIVVENNLQPKSSLPESGRIGLKNLQFQYDYLTGKQIEIENNESKFVVKLPKINCIDHAGTDH